MIRIVTIRKRFCMVDYRSGTRQKSGTALLIDLTTKEICVECTRNAGGAREDAPAERRRLNVECASCPRFKIVKLSLSSFVHES